MRACRWPRAELAGTPRRSGTSSSGRHRRRAGEVGLLPREALRSDRACCRGDPRADIPQSRRKPRSCQVTLDGLGWRRRHNAGQSALGRHSESSQPPPESAPTSGRSTSTRMTLSSRMCPLTSGGLTGSAVVPDWVVTSVGCDSGLQGQGCRRTRLASRHCRDASPRARRSSVRADCSQNPENRLGKAGRV